MGKYDDWIEESEVQPTKEQVERLLNLGSSFGGIVDAVESLPNDIRDDTCRLAHLVYQFSEALNDTLAPWRKG